MAAKEYIVDSVTKKRYVLGGCIVKDTASAQVKFGSQRLLSNNELPPAVDLRTHFPPIKNQGENSSCVGGALAGAYEFLVMKNRKKTISASHLFIYYNARYMDNGQTFTVEDDGATVEGGVKGLMKYGCCLESKWPLKEEHINKKPPPECYQESEKYRVSDAMSLNCTINEMKACLAQGLPFAFGLQVCKPFHSVTANSGCVAIPSESEIEKSKTTWHAMLAVGYSDQSKCFIVRNSWGTDWGDKGYCYVPFDYMSNPDLCNDMHCIILIDDKSQRQHERPIAYVNVYSWHAVRDNPVALIPSDPYPSFHFTFYWDMQDRFNYMASAGHRKRPNLIAPVNDSNETVAEESRMPFDRRDSSTTLHILWVDRKTYANAALARRLTGDSTVRIDFCETVSNAENYLVRKRNHIDVESFQVICRGYYRDEDRNPLNILRILIQNNLGRVPVLVLTRDKLGLTNHLQKQGPQMDLSDWRERLFITSDTDELLAKAKERLGGPRRDHRFIRRN